MLETFFPISALFPFYLEYILSNCEKKSICNPLQVNAAPKKVHYVKMIRKLDKVAEVG